MLHYLEKEARKAEQAAIPRRHREREPPPVRRRASRYRASCSRSKFPRPAHASR